MSIKKIILIIIVLLTSLTVLRLAWLQLFTAPNHPHPVKGVLDLQDWKDFSNYPVSLDGEWEFFPGEFLVEANRETGVSEQAKRFIQVPGSWDFTAEDSSKYGYGTYRLRIIVDPQIGKSFGINFKNIDSAAEVYINGELLTSSGRVGKDRENYEPNRGTYTAYFSLEEVNEIELMIQVANFDNPLSGGILSPPKFGLAEIVQNRTDFSVNIVYAACIIYLLHALYSFLLFLLGDHDYRLFYFSVVIIFVIIGTLIGENLLFVWLPLDFEWSIKLTNVLLLAAGFTLMQLTKYQLPLSWLKKFYKPFVVIMGGLAFLILILPTPHNMILSIISSMVVLVPCLVTIGVIYRTVTHINKDNIYLFMAMVVAVYSFIWLIMIEMMKIDVISYPFDLMIAIIFLAIYFFKQHFRTASNNKQLMMDLIEVSRMKDDFLVSVAYQLKDPLQGMINISETVIEKEVDGLRKDSVEDLKLLKTVGRRLSLLVNDLLELERIKDKRITIQKTEVCIHGVAESVVDMVRFMSKGRDVQLVNRISSKFPHVMADSNRLYQILFNLVHNAVKFSHDEEISIHASIQKGWAKISIVNDGHGMDDIFFEKIIESYRQNKSDNDFDKNGSGLGFAICKQLVELHGGKIEVKSKANEGTLIEFTLELANSFRHRHLEASKRKFSEETEEQVAVTKEVARSSVESGHIIQSAPIQILAVDDDPVNLKVLRSMFALESYEFQTATSGQQALEMLDKNNWDLLIIDVMMPTMSGYKLTERIRENYSISELPIILMNTYNREEGGEAAFQAGANDYVAHPIHAEEIMSRVKSLVKMRLSVNERLRMEAAWLQAQIQPHFIINTFYSITALSRMDLDRMDDLIEELSKFIRLSIDFQNSNWVTPLNRELELVRSYLFIQKERFGDRIKIIWELDGGIQMNIPPLTIQPLVENAITHGILKQAKGGVIRICLKDSGEFFETSIIDNGKGMNEETLKELRSFELKNRKRTGISLFNIDRRLKQFFGSGLKIESTLGKGTRVTFRIPKKEKRELTQEKD